MSNQPTRRQLPWLAALGLAGALLAACVQAPPAPTAAPPAAPAVPAAASPAPAGLEQQLYEAAKQEGRLSWWDSMDQAQAQLFINGFRGRYPGVEADLFVGNTADQRTRAVAEARAGSVGFDVIKPGGASGNYATFKQNGLVSDNSALLEAAGIAREYQFEGTYNPEWIVYGAAYNPKLVKAEELPRSWEGFLDPKWKGKLGVESRLNVFVYATPHWGGQEQVVSYLQKLRAQEPRFNQGDIASNNLLAAGEFPVLIGAYLQNYARYRQDGAPWAFVPLDEVYISTPGPGYTIPLKPPHPNAAKLFLYWLAGPEGRAIEEQRFDGNPLPGSGTGPSKFLQDRNMTVKMSPLEYSENLAQYQRKYLEAIGLPVN